MDRTLLIVTGSRSICQDDKVTAVDTLNKWRAAHVPKGSDLYLIHGAAPGVDVVAANWAMTEGHHAFACAALWRFYDHAAGGVRNDAMVALASSGVLAGWPVFGLAFPSPESSGTHDCVERMREVRIRYQVVHLKGRGIG